MEKQKVLKNKALIFIVEDNEGIREVYSGAFEDEYETRMFESGQDFFSVFPKKRPSLIILDIMLLGCFILQGL